MSYQEFLKVKKKLKYTWTTFFGQFGKLLPIQIKTIPLVLEGKDLIISSPTASGKTEAVVAPIIERLLNEKWEGLSILYISPTRALVNDIDKRLKGLLTECNVSLSVKTGDRPQFKPNKVTDMLITTPESLDSLLCRHPYIFKGIRIVILDEIHILDNTYRGDQLLLLLKRLKSKTEFNFNIYALSATIADCEELGKRYLDSYKVIEVKGSREIKYDLIPEIDDIVPFLRKEKLNKILVFCNKRKSVEALAVDFKNLKIPFEVVAHHGSLGKSVREEAENFMKTSKSGICVSTMTLEIGIDIGDIDAVVIAEIPWSVSSLLQRIGRGNRRSKVNRAFGIIHSDKEIKSGLEKMFSLAIKGGLESKPYAPDLSVVIQQIFSVLFANPGGLRQEFFEDLFENFCTTKNLRDIINHLEEKEWISKKMEKWYASEKLMNMGEIGMIHSNIPDESSMSVIDVSTKKLVGNILFPVDNIFILAGKVWKIAKIQEHRILVKRINSDAYLPDFELKHDIGKYFYYLPAHLRKRKYDLVNA